MATGVDSAVEGLTTFASHPNGSYRYVISVKSERINIWLEDRFSKKQWQSGFLSKDAYVTGANIFVDASAADYTACFKQCLDCSSDESEDSQCKLTALIEDKLQLELSIKLRLLQSVREVHYVFLLEPVAVKRIDILESKLKDQQEELEMLRGQVDTAKPVFLAAESVTWSSQKLHWKITSGEHFSLAANNTAIKVLCPGLYVISVLVNHYPTATGWISLEKNGSEIQRAVIGCSTYYDEYDGRNKSSPHNTSSSLMCIVQVKKSANFAVAFSNTAVISKTASYLTAVRIGV